MIVYEAHAVRDEGTVVVFEGVHPHSRGEDIVWFAVDHHQAADVEAAELVHIESWQVLGRAVTEYEDRDTFDGPDIDCDEDHLLAAAETRYERYIDRT